MRTGRNPRFWRDLDLEAWKEGEGAEWLKRQAEYPWGKRICKLTPQLGRISMDAYRAKMSSAGGQYGFMALPRIGHEVIKNDSHRTVENSDFSHIKGNDHRTVNGSHHSKQGKNQLIEAGSEIHHKAGMKIVIEADGEDEFWRWAGSGTAVSVKAPNLPVGLQAVSGDKMEPVALAVSGQRSNAPSASVHTLAYGAPHAGIAPTAEPVIPVRTALKEAASAGSQTISDCEYDEHGRCKIHQHGSVENTNVVLPASQSSSGSTAEASSGDTKYDNNAENAVEPGFHVVSQPMSKHELLQALYGDASAKPDHFDRLNPGIGGRVLPGEMIVLGDPEGMACTQEEADLMQAARQVNQRVRALDAKDAQFLTDYYDLLETMTSNSATGMGAGAFLQEYRA